MTTPKTTLPLFALLLLGSAAAPLPAQDAPAARPDRGGDVLARDPRLGRRVSLDGSKGLTLEKVLRELSRSSSVPLRTDARDGAARLFSLALRFRSLPLRDALRSLARVTGCDWKRDARDPKGALLLGFWHQYGAFSRPRSEAEAERSRRARELTAQLEKLPPEQRARLARDSDGGPDRGVPASELPPAMRETMRGLLSALNDISEEQGSPGRLNPNAPQATLSLSAEKRETFTKIRLKIGGGSYGLTLPDDPAFDHYVPGADPMRASEERAEARKREWERLRREAVASDPRMKRRVTLCLRDVDFAGAVEALTARAGREYVSQELGKTWGKTRGKNIDLENLPLHELLDRLCALYVFGEKDRGGRYRPDWSVSEAGTLLFASTPVDPPQPRFDRDAAWREVLDAFDELPPDLQDKMKTPDGVPFKDLPAGFRDAAQRLFTRGRGDTGFLNVGGRMMPMHDLGWANLRVELTQLSRGTGWSLRYGAPGDAWSGTSFRVLP